MDYKGTGEIRLFRLGQKNGPLVRVIPLDEQLRKRGVDERVAIDSANRLGKLFPQVGLKVDKPALARQLRVTELEEKLEEFKDIFRQTVGRINALEPTLVPSAEDSGSDEDDEIAATDVIE